MPYPAIFEKKNPNRTIFNFYIKNSSSKNLDIEGKILNLDCKITVKEKLKQIYKHNYNKIFGRNDVITLLPFSTQFASYYLKLLYQNNIIISFNEYGKGKYKFSLK